MYDKCYFCLDQLPKLKKESTASFFVNFGGAGAQKSQPTLLYLIYIRRGFRGTSLADRRVGLWPTCWKWRSRRLTFHTGDRWRRTTPTTDKLFCTNTENVSGRVQNGRPGKTTAGGDKHQGSAFLRSYLPLMLRTSHFTKQFISSISIATYYEPSVVVYRVFLTALP